MIDICDEIDWNEVWKSRTDRSRGSAPGRNCARIWESKDSALRFWDMCQRERSRIDQTVWETDITAESRVLDIGAGPGTLAIPFAQKAAHVTAVEPADGMCSVMREKMAEFGVHNIAVVKKRWEDVDVERDLDPPYDVVIASFSLGMRDIRAAIQKMTDASSRYVYLYHFAGPTSWDLQWERIWQSMHGREYRPGPKSDVLYNVLYQMGIYPHIRTFRLEHDQRYPSLDEATQDMAFRADAKTEAQKSILREYLREGMREEDGALVLPGWSTRVKMWWEK
ncbi:MAG: putative cobalt-precorrin-6Y C(15)-methyltransferase (decarboxylating) [Methanosaeta sp. PtaB.Bin039]|nr:MAG: putative cobalt-precorrin-6Y C(15)-methyltransferase (decarboxylating) [Methanosaeta sp. PtaB.Bin039]